MEADMRKIHRHAKAGAAVLVAAALGLVAGLILGINPGANAAAGLRAAAGGIAPGYAAVDPRDPATAQQVFLGQPLSDNAPIFPGDPPFHWQLWNCVNAHPSVPKCAQGSGYTLEQIQSLGTHTGTHISAPCHFHEGAPCLNQLPEKFFGLRPLVVINVKPCPFTGLERLRLGGLSDTP
jgi:Putative cyclase